MILSLLLLPLWSQAQTNNTGTNVTTVQGGFQEIVDAVKSGQTNWYFGSYAIYTPSLSKHVGAGISADYPLSQYIITGLRLDYVNGGFWMPSGNATFQLPLKLTSWLTVTPFAYAGIGIPISGSKVDGFTLGNVPKDNSGNATAILGYGGSVSLYSRGRKDVNWWDIDSVYLVGDRETWSGFSGQQYRAGLFFNKKF